MRKVKFLRRWGVLKMQCLSFGVNVYYEDIGSGFPVVLLHGFTPDHRLMKGCMEPIFTLHQGFRRLYIDLPGMGRTKQYNHIENTDGMLEVVLNFIDQILPNQPFLIAGESYGGYLTRGVIEKRRKQVIGALFICPNVIPDKENRNLPPRTILIQDGQLWDKLSLTEREEFQSIAVVANEYTWNRFRDEILVGCEVADYEFLDKIKGSYGLSFPLDTAPFTYPSLFLCGRQDSSVGYKDIWNVIEDYPRSSFAVLDCAGHNLQIEQSHLFAEFVLEWLGRVRNHLDHAGDNS